MKKREANETAQPPQRSLGNVAEVFIIGVVTFLAALIWRDALRQTFTRYFPRDNLGLQLIISVVVSIIAILIIYALSRNLSQVNLDGGEGLDE